MGAVPESRDEIGEECGIVDLEPAPAPTREPELDRERVALHDRFGIKSLTAFPSGLCPQVPIDEYTSRSEVNARVAFAFGASRQFELAVFGDNLTDEEYCVEIQDLRGVSGSLYCVPNEGEARYGLQARVSF